MDIHVDLDIFFFFNDTATTEIYTLSLHDALPILASEYASSPVAHPGTQIRIGASAFLSLTRGARTLVASSSKAAGRSEEHTSELQSRQYLVFRLLLEKNKQTESTCSERYRIVAAL